MSRQINAKQLAEILGISERRVNQLVTEEGILTREPNGKFNVQENVFKYFENKFRPGQEDELEIEKTLHERAKRKKTELQLALMEGRVHDAEDVERVMMDMLISFKSKIRALPVKIAPQINTNMNVAQIAELITTEIDSTLEELSEYAPSMFYSDDYIEIDEDNS